MKQVAAKNKVNEDSMSNYDSKVPAGWELKFIADVCNIYVGRDLKENNFSSSKCEEYQVPVYSNTVENEGLYGYYNIEEFSGESTTIVGRGAGLGTAFTRNGKYGAIGRLLVLFPKENVIAHYITEFVNGVLQIHQESGGIPQLTGEQISKYKITIPPLHEQKAIAHVLSTADTAINTTEKLIVQKELRKKWLMQQLLTGKKRLKGFSGKWKFVRFKEIYTQVKQKAGDDKHLVLSVTKDGIVSQAEYFNKEIASEDTSPYLVVRKGDMVMSGLNFWMGSIDVLSQNEIGMVSPAYKVFEICNPKISAEFMKSFVRSEIMLQCLIGSSVIGASIVRRNLDRETLEEWSFKIPSLEEQTAIAQVLQAAEKEISLLKLKAEKLREKKKGLMQKLLTGKIRIK
ncbi:MAG: restriction endonuclease subunit S [Bacteroidia bacterium]|jgi:restriction endonuclease S subunit|nr:restriction endonuclease subunit S [Bacteroidia bacterium]